MSLVFRFARRHEKEPREPVNSEGRAGFQIQLGQKNAGFRFSRFLKLYVE